MADVVDFFLSERAAGDGRKQRVASRGVYEGGQPDPMARNVNNAQKRTTCATATMVAPSSNSRAASPIRRQPNPPPTQSVDHHEHNPRQQRHGLGGVQRNVVVSGKSVEYEPGQDLFDDHDAIDQEARSHCSGSLWSAYLCLSGGRAGRTNGTSASNLLSTRNHQSEPA